MSVKKTFTSPDLPLSDLLNDVKDGKTGDGNIRALARGLTAQRRSQCVAAIFNQLELVLIGDLPQSIPIRYAADQIRDKNGFGIWGDHALEFVEIDLISIQHDIDKRRHITSMYNARDIGTEG